MHGVSDFSGDHRLSQVEPNTFQRNALSWVSRRGTVITKPGSCNTKTGEVGPSKTGAATELPQVNMLEFKISNSLPPPFYLLESS